MRGACAAQFARNCAPACSAVQPSLQEWHSISCRRNLGVDGIMPLRIHVHVLDASRLLMPEMKMASLEPARQLARQGLFTESLATLKVAQVRASDRKNADGLR